MNEIIKDLNLIELQDVEQINTCGGGEAWYWLGQVVRGFVEFGKGINQGGFSVCKVGY